MRAALLTEYRKLVSTRLWWILLLVMAGYVALIGGVFGLSVAAGDSGDTGQGGTPPVEGLDAATTIYSLVSSLGYVFPLVIGSLAVTTEVRYGTITQTFLVEPRRNVFVASKLLATAPIGLLFGIVGTAAVVAAGALALVSQGEGAYLGDPEVFKVIVFDVVVMVLWTMFGAAFGLVLTNQVAAIVVILAFTQLVEPIARVVLGSVDALVGVAAYLPGAAADSLIGASFFADASAGDLLPRWAGALVMLGYIAVLALIGRFTTLRRDVG